MIRYRNPTDDTIRRLERAYLADTSDLSAYEALLAARLRAGVPVDDPRTPPSSVEAYALLIEARVRSGVTTRPRVVMAARLGHAGAQAAAPEWAGRGYVRFNERTGCLTAVGTLGDNRERLSFACDCAERVLPVLEQFHPDDMKPRLAIEAARMWIISPSEKALTAVDAASGAVLVSAHAVGVFGIVAYARTAVARATNIYGTVSDDVVAEAIRAAALVFALSAGDTAFISESLRQQERLAQYLLGEVPLPSIKKTARKKTRSS